MARRSSLLVLAAGMGLTLAGDAPLVASEPPALAAVDRMSDAERTLREARSAADGLGHRRILWEILAELSRIVGEEEHAELVIEARGIVRSIAGTVDEDLRTSFVERFDVQELLG